MTRQPGPTCRAGGLALITAALGLSLLTGCASVDADRALSDARVWAERAGAPPPAIQPAAEQAAERQRWLQQPLDEATALQLALRSSPGAQALWAEGWQLQVDAASSATWPRLGLAFERTGSADHTVWTRSLSIGLAELLTLPWRHAAAERQQQVQRLQLARELLALHGSVRTQWVRAVAARQLLVYRQQVKDVADAGAELARRLQVVGNYSRLQQAREAVFALDATAQLARAQAQASAETEGLVRLLGLQPDEAARLRWPERLPAVPAAARDTADVTAAALRERLDVQLAWGQWRAATGAPRWADALDAELALHRERSSDGERSRGTELSLSLPLPDRWLALARSSDAGTRAAAQRLEQVRVVATSTLRERYASYRAAHEVALQYREQIVPLRKRITDDMLLKYNGMLVGVFDLLADARAQVDAVIGALEAERDFHLAQVALEGALLGVPGPAAGLAPTATAAADARGGH